MKKVVKSNLLVAILLIFLVGCTKKVTTEDLKANDWLIESANQEEPNMIASFSNHVMTIKIDSGGLASSAENEWEALGEEFAKNLIDNLDFKLEYTLKNNVMTIQDIEDESNNTEFTVTREDKNIVFTPKKDASSETLLLKPYAKTEKGTTETSSISSASRSTSVSTESELTEETTSNSTLFTSEETRSVQVTLADFIGGWGLPQSDTLFFIAADGSFTTGGIDGGTPSYPSYSFSTTPDGKSMMSLIHEKENTTDLILETDGTLTIEGATYIYLGNYTLDEFRAKKAAEDQALIEEQEHVHSENVTSSDAPANSFEAIESAKSFMADGGDSSQFDNYTFSDDAGVMADASGRPYYSIRVRQNGGNGMNSMAIGVITVYADTGECSWQ